MDRRELLLGAAAVPLSALLAGEARAARTGGTPTALVTADLQSHVAALDLSTGRMLRRIRTLPGPRSIESTGMTWAVVAHTAYGAVSIIDGVRLEVVHVIRGLGAPRYTAIRAGHRPLAYVTDSDRGAVITIDVLAGRVLTRTPVPGPARHVSLSPDGLMLWTALGTKAARVAVLDLEHPRRPRLRSTFTPPFLAHDVVCDPHGSRVWVTSGDAAQLAVYEQDALRPLAVVGAGAAPQHVAFRGDFDRRSRRVYVASGDDGVVRVFDTAAGQRGEIEVPGGSFNVVETTRGVMTPSLERGTLTVVDERRVLRVHRIAKAAHDAALVVTP
ncbi:MAG: YncE family protein [Gaiella sp.]